MLKEDSSAIWGTLEHSNVTGEMMALLAFIIFLVRHYHNPLINRIFRSGRIRIVFDNRIGFEAAQGAWLCRSEGPLSFLLRKGALVLSSLGLRMEPYWQASHGDASEDYITRGNARADLLVHYVRSAGEYFGRIGALDLPPKKTWPKEGWDEEFRPQWERSRFSEEDFKEDEDEDNEHNADEGVVDWVQSRTDGPAKLEDDFEERGSTPWRPNLFGGDVGLRFTQRYFYSILRSARWTRREVWRVAEDKIHSRWKDDGVQLDLVRVSCALARRWVKSNVQHCRIDLLHNAWLTARRCAHDVPGLTSETLRMLPVEEQERRRQRQAERLEEYTQLVELPCFYYGRARSESLEHWFRGRHREEGDDGCPVLEEKARRLELLDANQRMSVTKALGLDCMDDKGKFVGWAKFVQVVWRHLDWRRRHGTSWNKLADAEKGAYWTAALELAEIDYKQKLRASRARQIKAVRAREQRRQQQKEDKMGKEITKQLEMVVWNITRDDVKELEVLGAEVRERGCELRPAPGDPEGRVSWQIVGRRAVVASWMEHWKGLFMHRSARLEEQQTEGFKALEKKWRDGYCCGWGCGRSFAGRPATEKRQHEVQACPRREFLSFDELVKLKLAKEPGSRQLDQLFLGKGYDAAQYRISPIQLEEEVYMLQIAEEIADYYYGKDLDELYAAWSGWGEICLNFNADKTLLTVRGTKETMAGISAWMRQLPRVRDLRGAAAAPEIRPTGWYTVVAARNAKELEEAKARHVYKEQETGNGAGLFRIRRAGEALGAPELSEREVETAKRLRREDEAAFTYSRPVEEVPPQDAEPAQKSTTARGTEGDTRKRERGGDAASRRRGGRKRPRRAENRASVQIKAQRTEVEFEEEEGSVSPNGDHDEDELPANSPSRQRSGVSPYGEVPVVHDTND